MQEKRFDLSGKVAIVTGASRGIGRSIALGLAEHGADIAICARTKAKLEEVAIEAKKSGRHCLPIAVDMTKISLFDDLLRQVREEFGHIDVLVNNAGIAEFVTAFDLDENHWDTVMDTNVKGPFFLSQKVGRIMMDQGKGGSIVNITSEVVQMVEKATIGAYSPSKAALHGVTKTLAREWGQYQIRVNSLAPCFVRTEINEQIMEANREWYENKLKNVPLGRQSVPEDVVGAAIFLASDAARYITGTTILVDGGYTT
jgi:NAD(P)-dependent dehydrogenase (short-subunit alcohol dehydrogenase family)